MLIFSTSVSQDGFVTDRDGAFDWSMPDDERDGRKRFTRYRSAAAASVSFHNLP